MLVEVRAAALNDTGLWPRQGSCGTPGDPDALAGWRGPVGFPRIRGADVAGVVVSAGTELVGRRVVLDPAIDDAETPDANPAGLMGSERDGGYAEYVTAPARRVHDVADSPLSDVRLAALPTAYGTAPGMTRARRGPRGRHRRGDRCLGGVGPALAQLARARGARVLAVGSGSTLEAVRRAGAHEVLDRAHCVVEQTRTAAPDGVDAVLDVVAEDLVAEGLSLLREGAGGSPPALSADTPSRPTCAASGLHTPGSSGRACTRPPTSTCRRTSPAERRSAPRPPGPTRSTRRCGHRRNSADAAASAGPSCSPGRPRPGRDRPACSGPPGPPCSLPGGPGSPSRRVRLPEAPGGRPPGGEADARGGRAVRRAAAAVECSARSPA